MVKTAILGASGYTGAELVRVLAGHPGFEIAALAAHSRAGQPMGAVYPHLAHLDLPALVTVADVAWADIELAFCALPHGTSAETVAGLPDHVRIIDLSADFRLRDPEAYARWYGKAHVAPELLPQAVYGLTEFYRDAIAETRLVAGTGCNAATGQYILRPLLAAGVIDPDDIQLDLKVGTSGAGRAAKENLLLSEVHENVVAYGLGGSHRHLGEFDQELSAIAGRTVEIGFLPHLIPASRGILATAYVRGDAAAIHGALVGAYAAEPFLDVLPMGEVPAMKTVRGSNLCRIGVVADRRAGHVTVVATLDNLTKGSSGQALQNANVMFGFDETTALQMVPLYP